MTMTINPIPSDLTVSDILPPIILGAGVFNYQYHPDANVEKELNVPAKDVIKRAFELGINALDTSAYYGPSEIIVGKALKELDFPRNSYKICTKAGRNADNTFDYNPKGIEKSINRSLERLNTDYLDVVYIHDVEFVPESDTLEAVGKLFELKEKGIIHHVGISGYPVDYLAYISYKIKKHLQPLDIILSYSNFCLQNTILEKYLPDFYSKSNIKTVVLASPLSMSLLRSGTTHDFHPASTELKKSVEKASDILKNEHNVELASLATRFVLKEWKGPLVFGLVSVEEVETAVKTFWEVKNDISKSGEELVEIFRSTLGDHINEVWPSGIEHEFNWDK